MQQSCMVIHSLRQLHIVNFVDYIHSLRQLHIVNFVDYIHSLRQSKIGYKIATGYVYGQLC